MISRHVNFDLARTIEPWLEDGRLSKVFISAHSSFRVFATYLTMTIGNGMGVTEGVVGVVVGVVVSFEEEEMIESLLELTGSE